MLVERRYRSHPLRVEGIRVGNDISVTVYGGQKPHIGGVAMSVMSPALHEPERLTCTEHMISVQGHKEADLARTVASHLAKMFECTITVSCGIHYTDATEEDITAVLALVDEMVDEFARILMEEGRITV